MTLYKDENLRVPANELRGQTWRTCMMRVLQVEKRGSLLLPDLLVFLQLLPVVPQFVVGRDISLKETFLEPYLSQKHVQCDGSHHEPDVETESGPQDLHAGPGVSVSFNFDRCRAGDGEH